MEGIAAIKSFFVALPIDYFIVLNISFENIPLYMSKQMFLRLFAFRVLRLFCQGLY